MFFEDLMAEYNETSAHNPYFVATHLYLKAKRQIAMKNYHHAAQTLDQCLEQMARYGYQQLKVECQLLQCKISLLIKDFGLATVQISQVFASLEG